MPSARQRRHRSSAQGIVEFALVAPIFFLLLLGTIEFGRAVFTFHELHNGAREGMRYAVVRGTTSGSPATSTEVKTVFLDKTASIPNSVDVVCSGCPGARGDEITVTATHEFDFLISFPGIPDTVTIVAESKGVVHN